jgi:hypothetical protein
MLLMLAAMAQSQKPAAIEFVRIAPGEWAAGLTRSEGKTVITLGGLPSQPYSAKPNGDPKVKQ